MDVQVTKTHRWRTHDAVAKQQEPVKAPIPCCECGRVSFWRVKKKGYCEGHREEAFAAQAQWWAEKMRKL